MWDNIEWSNIPIIGVSKGDVVGNQNKNWKMVKNFSNLMKTKPTDKNKQTDFKHQKHEENYTKSHN